MQRKSSYWAQVSYSVLAVACLVASTVSQAATPKYRITLINAPGNIEFDLEQPFGLNDRGDVVFAGFSCVPESPCFAHAFVWRNGKARPIAPPVENMSIAPYDINDRREILIMVASSESGLFIWRRGQFEDLGRPPVGLPGGSRLNNHQQVIGVVVANGIVKPSLWEEGHYVLLPELPDVSSEAFATETVAINDAGVIVGRSTTTDGYPKAVKWQDRVISRLPIPGDTIDSQATGINNRGHIVGFAGTQTGMPQALLWRGDQVTELPLPAGSSSAAPVDINDHDQVVGQADGNSETRGVLWDDGTPYLLSDLVRANDPNKAFMRLDVPVVINNRGEILVMAWDRRVNRRQIVLLEPVKK